MLAQWYPYADNADKDASELNARVSELSGQVSVLAWNLEKANRQIKHLDQSLQQSLKKANHQDHNNAVNVRELCEVVRLLQQDLEKANSQINHQDQHIQSLQQGMIRRGKQLPRQDQQIQSMQEKVQKLLSDWRAELAANNGIFIPAERVRQIVQAGPAQARAWFADACIDQLAGNWPRV